MRRTVCFALACTAVAASPKVAPAQLRGEPEPLEAIVELRILGGPTGIIDALMLDSTLFLSVPQFQELAEIRVTEIVPGIRFASVLEPTGTPVLFDTDGGRLERGDSVFALSPARAIWRGGTLYAAPEQIGRALAIIVTVDWENLLVAVRKADHLPAVRRFDRIRRRAPFTEPALSQPMGSRLQTRRKVANGAVLDWALTSTTRDPWRASTLDLGFGAQLLGGSVAVEYSRTSATEARVTSAEASWSKAWPHHPWLRQIRVGDGFSTGRAPRRLRGVSLSNAPFHRSSEFGQLSWRGSLPFGWEVELHQTDRLLAFANAELSNEFEFEVPLRYGQNLLELVTYGPAGEVRRQRRAIVIPQDRLPGGQLEYGVTAGQCTADPCTAMLSLDLRYGLSSTFTLHAGSDLAWRDTLPDWWSPYARLSAAATRSLGFALEIVGNSFVSGQVQYSPSPDFEASVTHVDFGLGQAVPSPWPTHIRRQTQGFLFWRPNRRGAGTFFRMTAHLQEAVNRKSDAIRLSSRTRLAGSLVEVGLERRRDQMNRSPRRVMHRLDLAATSVLAGLTPWGRSTVVRGELALQFESGLTLLRGSVARRIGDNLRVELETSWRRAAEGFAIALNIVTALPSLRAASRNKYSVETGLQGIQSLEGSLLWDDDDRRVTFTDGRSVGRGGLAGDVFLDENSNGRRDADEAGVPDVRLRIGPKAVTTDSLGRFATWDLMPFEPIPVEVDTLSIRNPLWVPSTRHASVVPTPNSFGVIEFPLVRAVELRGRVVLSPGEEPVGGIRLVLQDNQTNATIVVTSFSDGAFYFHGLRPASYRLTVAAPQLEQLGATFEPVTVNIDRRDTPQVADGVVVRLRRR